MAAPTPANEAARLAALQSYDLLDTDAEAAYDDVARIASAVCGTPIALVVLLDADRQWFKARVGLDAAQTPREHAFCAHAVHADATLVVRDARADARFSDNPLVTAAPYIRFYAGAPLRTADGFALGTLCVIDDKPRDFPPEHRTALEALARQVVALMDLRRVSARLAGALRDVAELQALLPLCAWCRKVKDDAGYWGQVEEFFRKEGRGVTHGICPECYDRTAAEIGLISLPGEGRSPTA